MAKLLSLDIETTGVNVKSDRPVQISLVFVHDNGARQVLMNTYANPEMPIDIGATQVNGIDNKMVLRFPNYQVAVWTAYVLSDAFKPDFLVTFNGSQFDAPIMDRVLGLTYFSKLRHIDVLDVAYRYLPGLSSFKLGSVYAHLTDSALEGAHDALADINGTLDCLDVLKSKLAMSYEQLADDLSVPRPYVIFPISQKHKGKLLQEVPKGFAQWLLDRHEDNPLRPDLKASVDAILAGFPNEQN